MATQYEIIDSLSLKVPFDEAIEELEQSMGHLIRAMDEDGIVWIDCAEQPGQSYACFPIDGMFYYEY